MTDHTQAPERMWIRTDPEYHARWGCWYVTQGPLAAPPRTEYTRTDTIPRWSTDMDAAPKDGTLIFAWSNTLGPIVCRWWKTSSWKAGWVLRDGHRCVPIRWMPIPPEDSQ